jgi:hypothetical protein
MRRPTSGPFRIDREKVCGFPTSSEPPVGTDAARTVDRGAIEEKDAQRQKRTRASALPSTARSSICNASGIFKFARRVLK